MGKAHPKTSLVFDAFSMFARFGHWANFLELTTKVHGGWTVGGDLDFSEAKIYLALESHAIKIPGYDFEGEVKYQSKDSCPDHCKSNPCTYGCYCGDVNFYQDLHCAKCNPCSFNYGDAWSDVYECDCSGETTGICDAKCKTDNTQDGCICGTGGKDSMLAAGFFAPTLDTHIASQCETPLPYPSDFVKPAL